MKFHYWLLLLSFVFSISVLDVVIELEDDEDNPFLIKEPEIGNFFSYIF